MIRLVRDSIAPLIHKATDGHAGLLMQRGLQVWEESAKEDKQDLISLLGSIQPSELYLLAFNRWLKLTYQDDSSKNSNSHFASIGAQIEGRLFTGLSTGGTLETGATTHHSYGMPMLPGSAVKGAVRNYAESLFVQKDASGQAILDENGRTKIDPAMQDILNILFGTDENAIEQNAGYLIWHDAWWVPPLTQQGTLARKDDARPFVGEIVTVHHQKYYSGVSGWEEALDMESPIPNQQIAIQGGFYFVIEGEPQWVQFAKQLLENMLQQFGMGAKGAAGYGYFKLDPQLDQLLSRQYKLITRPAADPNDIYAKARIEIENYTEVQLYEALAKSGRTKSFAEFGLDKTNAEHCAQVVQLALQYHAEWIKSTEWAESKKKTVIEALKFIKTYLAE